MKKIVIFFSLLALMFSRGFKNRGNGFFGVYGKTSMVMGKMDGSAMEFWVYPFKIAHDFRFSVREGEEVKNPYTRLASFSLSPELARRRFVAQNWTITETAFPSISKPIIYLVYRINAEKPLDLVFTFKPDLKPMWPGCLGGRFSYWDERGGYILSEASWKNFAVIGFPPSGQGFKLPAHKLPGGLIKYIYHVEKGETTLVIPLTEGPLKPELLLKRVERARNTWKDALKERKNTLDDLAKSLLRVASQDPRFTEGMQLAVLKLHLSLVKNPWVGEGLVAGYGLSGDSERPGFAWFFGGDGSINSMAALDAGDFSLVKREIEFLFSHQRRDGKIPHEISQGMKPEKWFKNYGFGYFHGDTTLYFAVLLGDYLRRTGDLRLMRKYAGKIYRLMSWMLTADGDDDGLVETKKAGAGAAEVGPMKQKVKTDILLASLSVKAWESLAYIWKALKSRRNYLLCRKLAQRARTNFERGFWNGKRGIYNYALKMDNSPVDEMTSWISIPLMVRVTSEEHGMKATEALASPWLSTDWGVRFLSNLSRFYEPAGYNSGAVWPFLTGFASLALYRYSNPYHGFYLLQTLMNDILDYDYGAGPEVLSGNLYVPLDESVPDQIWSIATPVSAFVRGLLGFQADALARKIALSPQIPLYWRFLKVENIRVGTGSLDLTYRRKGGKVKFILTAHGLRGYSLKLKPNFPGTVMGSTGKTVKELIFPPLSSDEKLEVELTLKDYAFPFVRVTPLPGQSPKTPIIAGFTLKKEGFNISIWGKGTDGFFLLSDREIYCPETKIIKIRNLRKIVAEFGPRWKKLKIECRFKGPF